MATLKYKVIKSKVQYKDYCNTLENLITLNSKSKELKEEIELLTLLIENGMTNTTPLLMLIR